MDTELTLDKFEEATEIVQKVIHRTKLQYSEFFSNQTGNKIYLKPENMQKTGAYKIRGAYYKISTLSKEERERGLVTASAGNHAQGVAYAAKAFGVPATVVMPTSTPLMKVNRTKSYGADVVLYGDVYDDSCAYAMKLAEEKGIRAIAFPSISTGVYGYPVQKAAETAVSTVKMYVNEHPDAFDEILWVLFDRNTYQVYTEALGEATQ